MCTPAFTEFNLLSHALPHQIRSDSELRRSGHAADYLQSSRQVSFKPYKDIQTCFRANPGPSLAVPFRFVTLKSQYSQLIFIFRSIYCLLQQIPSWILTFKILGVLQLLWHWIEFGGNTHLNSPNQRCSYLLIISEFVDLISSTWLLLALLSPMEAVTVDSRVLCSLFHMTVTIYQISLWCWRSHYFKVIPPANCPREPMCSDFSLFPVSKNLNTHGIIKHTVLPSELRLLSHH